MDIKQLGSQLLNTATLYFEVLICVAAASILGLIVGLMMQRSRHKRSLSENNAKWEERYQIMESSARDDAENLEEQLQSLANETKSVQTTNRALTDSLKKNDSNMQKSRAEAIELNRQHTESHERLQRIIQQKDREIAELGSRLNLDIGSSDSVSSTTLAQPFAASTKLADTDLNNADTVAISPVQLSSDSLDDTLDLSNQLTANSKITGSKGNSANLEASFDDTSDLNDMGLEESTIAMDDEALAFAQRSYKSRSND